MAQQKKTADESQQSIVLPSIPVEIAIKVVSRVLVEALSGQGRFRTEDGYTRWGMVDHVIQDELEKASNGETMEWRGEREPEDARKVRMLDRVCRRWPEPAVTEAVQILSGITVR